MKAFRQHTGLVAPLDRANVDTDQIIPKQFLKRIERTGFESFCFTTGVICLMGSRTRFVLNEPRYQGRRFWLRIRISVVDRRASMRRGRLVSLGFR